MNKQKLIKKNVVLKFIRRGNCMVRNLDEVRALQEYLPRIIYADADAIKAESGPFIGLQYRHNVLY